jgi:hypothetical protein
VEDSMNNVFCRITNAVIIGTPRTAATAAHFPVFNMVYLLRNLSAVAVCPMAVIDTVDDAGTDVARRAVQL